MLVVIFFVSLFFAKRSIQPLKEAWRKQRQFVADASHELKTPLAIIMSNYDVLIANQDETIRSQKDWLDYMGIGMDRMTKLINDLLLLANIEKDQPITKECFHINDSISDIINAMTSLADGKEIKLIFKPQAMITLVSNKDMMEQVITILLDNAIKYSYCNTIISLNTSYNRKKQVVISVENHGEGIAADALERIFDRFYQADAARTAGTEGYGLGLPIAQSILKQLRGSILCESDSSGTTRFFITLSG